MMSIGIARSTPPTAQAKVKNVQRNGNVQATLEDQIIKLAKEIYHLRRQISGEQEKLSILPSDASHLETLTRSLEEAWTRYYALEEQLEQNGHRLSLNALKIIEYAKGNVNHNSLPPGIMMGLFK